MSARSLADWLAYQEGLHPNTIDLGLDRLSQVLVRLQWRQPAYPVITVGGTNGKGSCVALLESVFAAGGYRVGTFTSPHLIRYNERIRVAGCEVTDASLVAAFERIELARGDISLTFFEFNALAALLVFETAGLDLMVLEVGLGGRLDAVNVVSADIALISSIALDHCDWLGNDVESIGREKAGIFREGRMAVFGSRAMPKSIASEAQRVGASLLQLDTDFRVRCRFRLCSGKRNWKMRRQF
jgi:dihydrofolate synthase/folylpolyglutamate synthase